MAAGSPDASLLRSLSSLTWTGYAAFSPALTKDGSHATELVVLVLSTLAVAMRVYTRLVILRVFKTADYSICLAWVTLVGYFAEAWILGDTIPSIEGASLDGVKKMLFLTWIGRFLLYIAIFFIKLSILTQYLELFVVGQKKNVIYWSCHLLIWTNFVYYFIATFLALFACRPVAGFWDPYIESSCIDVNALDVAGCAINSISDILILIVPQLVIWKLKMSLRKRIAISAVFAIGVFACVSSIIRLATTVVYARDASAHYGNSYYGIVLAAFWTLPELTSGFLAACLPVTPKLLQIINNHSLVTTFKGSLERLWNEVSMHTWRTRGQGSRSEEPTSIEAARYQGSKTWINDNHHSSSPHGSSSPGQANYQAKVAAEDSQKVAGHPKGGISASKTFYIEHSLVSHDRDS